MALTVISRPQQSLSFEDPGFGALQNEQFTTDLIGWANYNMGGVDWEWSADDSGSAKVTLLTNEFSNELHQDFDYKANVKGTLRVHVKSTAFVELQVLAYWEAADIDSFLFKIKFNGELDELIDFSLPYNANVLKIQVTAGVPGAVVNLLSVEQLTDNPYYTSYWNAGGGNLPINYKLLSDKFPVNKVDPALTISSVTNFQGFAQLNFSASHGLNAKEWIEITGTANYNGVYNIAAIIDSDSLVINIKFNGADTGVGLKYYKSYHAIIRLFSGISDNHPLSGMRPMKLIGDIPSVPDSANISTCNVSGFIKDALKSIYEIPQLCGENDINAWTQFYISYAESYDVVTGGEVVNFTSAFLEDTYDNPGAALQNEEFVTDLADWIVVEDRGRPWAWNSDFGGNASAFALDPFQQSDTLGQLYNYIQGIQYSIFFSIEWSAYTRSSKFAIELRSSVTGNTQIILGPYFSGTLLNMSINFTPNANYDIIQFYTEQGTSIPSPILRLKYFIQSVVGVSPFRANLFSTNSVQQLGYKYGGNMGEYVAGAPNLAVKPKFATVFEKPKMWLGTPFTLPIILSDSVADVVGISKYPLIPNSGFDASRYNLTDGDYAVTTFNPMPFSDGGDYVNSGGNIEYTNNLINGYPVMRAATGNVSTNAVTLAGASYFHYFAVIKKDASFATIRQLSNYSDAYGAGAVLLTQFSPTTFRLITYYVDNVNSLTVVDVSYPIALAATDYAIIVNYDKAENNVKLYINNILVANYAPYDGNNPKPTFNAPVNGAFSHAFFYSAQVAEVHYSLDQPVSDCDLLKIFNYANTKYDLRLYNNLILKQLYYNSSGIEVGRQFKDIINKSYGMYRIEFDQTNIPSDAKIVKAQIAGGEFCEISEEKTVEIIRDCYHDSIVLTWLSGLSWDMFKFDATLTKNQNVKTEAETIVDRYVNFPQKFINENSDINVVRKSAGIEVELSAGGLRYKDILALVDLCRSISIYDITNPDKHVRVKIKDTSMNYYETLENLYEFSVSITYPNLEIQNQ